MTLFFFLNNSLFLTRSHAIRCRILNISIFSNINQFISRGESTQQERIVPKPLELNAFNAIDVIASNRIRFDFFDLTRPRKYFVVRTKLSVKKLQRHLISLQARARTQRHGTCTDNYRLDIGEI